VKRFVFKISIFAVSILLSLIIVEITLKFFYKQGVDLYWGADVAADKEVITQLDDDLIYSLRPYSETTWQISDYEARISINSQGLRNEEVEPKGKKKRILILGDSFTFGHGVSLSDSYPKQLEQVLGDGNWEVINAGVIGYDGDQMYRFYARKLQRLDLDPDVVILTFGQGDFYYTECPLYSVVNGQLVSLDARKSWFYIIACLYKHAPNFLRKTNTFRVILNSITGKNFYNLFSSSLVDIQQGDEIVMKKTLFEIEDLSKRADLGGWKLLIVFAPFTTGNEYDFKRLSEFKEVLEDENIRYIDPNENNYYRSPIDSSVKVLGDNEIDWQKLTFENDSHLTAEGNYWFAKLVAEGMNDLF
jgi:hypothetical protein